MLLCLAGYLFTRLNEIERFPVYFFCDEAIHSVRYEELRQAHWRGTEPPRELLPAYYRNGGMYNLSLSVFVQGLGSLIGGRTIATVRTTSAIFSLGGAIALGLLLRTVFRLREWWVVVPVLMVTPCWFLHTRTGFETVLMVSSYSWFLFFYLLYREVHPRWIFGAMVAGAATFYAYSPGQGVMAITGFFLLLVDAPYHRSHWRWAAAGAGWGLLLFAPYLRFRIEHPDMVKGHLQILGSYWVTSIPLTEKLQLLVKNYFAGLSPRFWFVVGADPAVRHVVPFLPHLPLYLAPFAIVGVVRCLINWRSPCHRLVLIAFLATPFSSALVATMVTRMLAFVVPFSLAVALGFDGLLGAVRLAWARVAVRWVSYALFLISGVGLLLGAKADGPLYSRDYGLYGMQWGTVQLFRDVLPRYLKSDPAANIVISHTSFNEPEVFPSFFNWADPRRVYFASADDIASGRTLPEVKDIVVVSSEEYARLPSQKNVRSFAVRERLDFPDGRPGFYIGHVTLDPEFVRSVRLKSGWYVRPEWDRVLCGDVPCAVIAGGVAHGRTGWLFTDRGETEPVIGSIGGAINVEIHFDQPVRLKSIEVGVAGAGDSQISIWGLRQEVTRVVRTGLKTQSSVRASLEGEPIDVVRVELAAKAGVAGRLNRIRILPETQP
jgi:hypothetical protein